MAPLLARVLPTVKKTYGDSKDPSPLMRRKFADEARRGGSAEVSHSGSVEVPDHINREEAPTVKVTGGMARGRVVTPG